METHDHTNPKCDWPMGPCICIPAPARTNLDDALEYVTEIQKIYSVQRELKAAFARSELDGGVKAAASHPLYIECEERLAALREQLMMVF